MSNVVFLNQGEKRGHRVRLHRGYGTAEEYTERYYVGSTATIFKARYGNHKASMTHETKACQSELSKCIYG